MWLSEMAAIKEEFKAKVAPIEGVESIQTSVLGRGGILINCKDAETALKFPQSYKEVPIQLSVRGQLVSRIEF